MYNDSLFFLVKMFNQLFVVKCKMLNHDDKQLKCGQSVKTFSKN